jgi:hypothetical protein
MNRRRAAILPLLVTVMLMTACGSAPGGTPGSAGATVNASETPTGADQGGGIASTAAVEPSPAPTTTAPPAPKTALEAIPPAPAQELEANRDKLYCPKGSQEGCYGYADMPSYLGQVVALLTPLFDGMYGVANRPAAFNYVPAGVAGPTACLKDDGTPDQYGSQDYSYCTADRAIYTGQDGLWSLYKGVGGAAAAVGYAHEWGHHIQNVMGVPEPETPEQNTVLEIQADCIAGAWVQHAAQSGYLDYPKDLGDMNALLTAIAPPDPGEAATPVQERINALLLGYNNGLPGCNSFFPGTPIYKG